LCGAHPFFDNEGQLMVQSLLVSRYVPCTTRNARIPLEIAQLIERCLEKEPAARPPSIWRVETALLEHLQAQGLLSQSKLWVESPEQQPLLLMEALKTKHEGLKAAIHEQLSTPKRDMRFLVSRINEFHALFPNDLDLPIFLEALRAPKAQPRRRLYIALAALLLVLGLGGGVGLWMLRPQTETPAVAIAPIEPVKAPVSPPTPTPAPAPVAAAPKPRPKPPEVPMGALEIIAEPDVKAAIDGKPLARGQFSGHKLPAGKHILRLEKPGYPPIEQNLNINVGKTATVNTIPRSSP
jgi:hypothetical protein